MCMIILQHIICCVHICVPVLYVSHIYHEYYLCILYYMCVYMAYIARPVLLTGQYMCIICVQYIIYAHVYNIICCVYIPKNQSLYMTNYGRIQRYIDRPNNSTGYKKRPSMNQVLLGHLIGLAHCLSVFQQMCFVQCKRWQELK